MPATIDRAGVPEQETAVRVAARVSALSTAAPFARPARQPGGPAPILLVSGAPAPESLPLADFRRAADHIFADRPGGEAALDYGPHAGLPGLREWIGRREGADPAQVLVTNGALHGISLIFSTLLDHGDVVVLDDPVFPDTVRIAEQYGATILPVAVGSDGIDVQAIADHLRAGVRIKVVYTVPDFHNPSGGVLPASDRLWLVDLAERYGFVIVSDNPYRDTTFGGGYVDDFAVGSSHVVRVGTFTKTLGAGWRLGWLIAPPWLVPHLENVRRRIDFHSGTVGQSIVLELLGEPGWFDRLLVRNRSIHREKAAVFSKALAAHTSGDLEFTAPDGGFFVWATLTSPERTAAPLVSAAAARGLLLTSGRHFAADGGRQWNRHLRFAFSAPTVDQLPVAAQRLAAALDDTR